MNYLAIGYSDDFIFSRPIFACISGEEDDPKYPYQVASMLTQDCNYDVMPSEWDQILLVDFDTNDQVPRVLRHWTAEHIARDFTSD